MIGHTADHQLHERTIALAAHLGGYLDLRVFRRDALHIAELAVDAVGHLNDSHGEGFGVEAYAHRASSRHFEGQPNLVALAGSAARLAGAKVPGLLSSRLAQLDDAALAADLQQLPDRRMSQAARIFALRMLVENKRRLLDELDR